MKPNEIKKALECCCSKTEMFCTKDCPLYEYNGNCWYAMKFDALAYINQLEAEVERLKEYENIRPVGCPNCHRGNFSNSKFCSHCGRQLRGKKKEMVGDD